MMIDVAKIGALPLADIRHREFDVDGGSEEVAPEALSEVLPERVDVPEEEKVPHDLANDPNDSNDSNDQSQVLLEIPLNRVRFSED
jgi:hypothetical protein